MRPIDAHEVIAKIRRYEDWECPSTGSAIEAVQTILHIVGDAPTLTLDDLRPKGRWNIVEIDKANNRITVECSECGMVEEMYLTTYGMGHNYCHSCGADLRGE